MSSSSLVNGTGRKFGTGWRRKYERFLDNWAMRQAESNREANERMARMRRQQKQPKTPVNVLVRGGGRLGGGSPKGNALAAQLRRQHVKTPPVINVNGGRLGGGRSHANVLASRIQRANKQSNNYRRAAAAKIVKDAIAKTLKAATGAFTRRRQRSEMAGRRASIARILNNAAVNEALGELIANAEANNRQRSPRRLQRTSSQNAVIIGNNSHVRR
jgi:hypothetical protein